MRFSLLLAGFVLAVFLAGCAPPVSALPDCQSVEVICVGFVTDIGGLQDYGLNEQAWKTLQDARADGIVIDVIESVEVRDYRKNIAYFANLNYDLVITAGYDLAEITLAMAEEYPDLSFLMLGQAPPEEDAPLNLAGVVFPEEQAGFLAGSLAASFSKTDKVAAVFAHPEIPSVAAYARGFEAGAQGVQVDVVFHADEDFASSLNDPIWGADQAFFLEQAGADVLFAYGGKTAISAMEQARGRVIGVEVDLARRFPYFRNQVIASVVFDLSVLKEIVPDGQVSQPLYEAGYQVIWGNIPTPEVGE
jgi:basic membrane protein A